MSQYKNKSNPLESWALINASTLLHHPTCESIECHKRRCVILSTLMVLGQRRIQSFVFQSRIALSLHNWTYSRTSCSIALTLSDSSTKHQLSRTTNLCLVSWRMVFIGRTKNYRSNKLWWGTKEDSKQLLETVLLVLRELTSLATRTCFSWATPLVLKMEKFETTLNTWIQFIFC